LHLVAKKTLRPSARPVRLREAIRPLPVSYEWAGRRHTIDDFLERSGTLGFVVLDGRKIVAERYRGVGRDTRFQSWSVAKSFTGTAVGIALGEGRIRSIDDPVTRYVPELGRSGYAGVSIRDLLRMSSGIAWEETRDVPVAHVGVAGGASIQWMAGRQRRGWAPGSRFEYTSMNSFVLAWVVSRATGTPFRDYLQRRIWNAAGMAGTAYLGSDRYGAELGYCCIHATARDFARFGLLFLRNGRAGGRQVVPESWVRASTRPSAPFNEPEGETSSGYGFQWWIGGGGHGDYMASGLGGQRIYVSPRHGVVITKNTVYSDTSGGEELTAFRAVAAYVAATRSTAPAAALP
jgi:CubicO group peptidase (beta-lactamase class C family)